MKTVQLQGIGSVSAKQAGELSIGEVTVWNFGGMETVKKVEKETSAFITFIMDTGHGEFTRRLKKSRLVGVAA